MGILKLQKMNLKKSFLNDKKKLIRKSWIIFRNDLVATIFISFGFIESRFSLKPKVFRLAVSISLGKKSLIKDDLDSLD